MPSWINNEIALRGVAAKRQAFKESVAGDKRAFDFNRLVPMPPSLSISCGSDTDLGLACWSQPHFDHQSSFGWFAGQYPSIGSPRQLRTYLMDHEPRIVEVGKRAAANLAEYGVPTWYEWRVKNWGTKWNARRAELTEDAGLLVFHFDTPYDAPRALVAPLLKRAHELGLSVTWIVDHAGRAFMGADDEDGSVEALVDEGRLAAA
jgi:hypothetical protein